MKKTRQDLWFGVYGKEYAGNEPAFIDDADLSCADFLRSSFPIIKGELAPLMEKGNGILQPYFASGLQFPPNNWKTTGFYFWGKKSKLPEELFPETFGILHQIPNLLTASFNLLEPHSRILPHFGETNGTLRIHMGISVPGDLPDCGFTVKGESRSWKEGELLVFLDANKHEAFNDKDEPRYILLLEVVRPEYIHLKRYICIKSLGILSFYFVICLMPFISTEKLAKVIRSTPDIFIDFLISPFRFIWWTIWMMTKRKRKWLF